MDKCINCCVSYDHLHLLHKLANGENGKLVVFDLVIPSCLFFPLLNNFIFKGNTK